MRPRRRSRRPRSRRRARRRRAEWLARREDQGGAAGPAQAARHRGLEPEEGGAGLRRPHRHHRLGEEDAHLARLARGRRRSPAARSRATLRSAAAAARREQPEAEIEAARKSSRKAGPREVARSCRSYPWGTLRGRE
ncbi:MAG: hypothetical protein MZV64_23795 [Ignavibacteriales bacterium]|nr:hypothetical protein [Ignavibacteriales bacterium]